MNVESERNSRSMNRSSDSSRSASVSNRTQSESSMDFHPYLPGGINLDVGEYDIRPDPQVLPNKNALQSPPGAKVATSNILCGVDSQHKYVRRWIDLVEKERSGKVKFTLLRNDGTRESLEVLLALRNAFARQLPNMPKSYIARLVFDAKHESIAIQLRNDDTGKLVIIGGICYRPFLELGFAELAFLSVRSLKQNMGYGGRLMQHAKERIKALNLRIILTSADESAVPYFRKQGFTDKITVPHHVYADAIKEYCSVTLMQCTLYDHVDFLNVPPLIKSWKLALEEKKKEISRSHIVYPGIDFSKIGRKPLENVPGTENILSNVALRRRQKMCDNVRTELINIVDQMLVHRSSGPFRRPVNVVETGALDYYDRIANPIDLGTIRKKLEEGWFYVTKEMFVADVTRMFENCRTYNGPDHVVTLMGDRLERYFLNQL